MFDKPVIDAHKSIKPSSDFKERVMQMEANETKEVHFFRYPKSALLISACVLLVLLFLPTMLYPTNHLTIRYEGNQINNEAVSINASPLGPASYSNNRTRSISQLTIPLEIGAKKDTKLAISNGTLVVIDPETNTKLYEGTSTNIHGNILIYWTLDLSEESKPSTMTLENKETTTLIVNYEGETSSYSLTKESK